MNPVDVGLIFLRKFFIVRHVKPSVKLARRARANAAAGLKFYPITSRCSLSSCSLIAAISAELPPLVPSIRPVSLSISFAGMRTRRPSLTAVSLPRLRSKSTKRTLTLKAFAASRRVSRAFMLKARMARKRIEAKPEKSLECFSPEKSYRRFPRLVFGTWIASAAISSWRPPLPSTTSLRESEFDAPTLSATSDHGKAGDFSFNS